MHRPHSALGDHPPSGLRAHQPVREEFLRILGHTSGSRSEGLVRHVGWAIIASNLRHIGQRLAA